jgi:hypothetical protein
MYGHGHNLKRLLIMKNLQIRPYRSYAYYYIKKTKCSIMLRLLKSTLSIYAYFNRRFALKYVGNRLLALKLS